MTQSDITATGASGFQARVAQWCRLCFGKKILEDSIERGDRLLEEVFELLQSCDYPQERIRSLQDYTWARSKGQPDQELGGVMVTLAAFSAAFDLDMTEAGEREYRRITRPEIIRKIRVKQAAKPVGTALLSTQMHDAEKKGLSE